MFEINPSHTGAAELALGKWRAEYSKPRRVRSKGSYIFSKTHSQLVGSAHILSRESPQRQLDISRNLAGYQPLVSPCMAPAAFETWVTSRLRFSAAPVQRY